MEDEGGKGGAALQKLGVNLANLQRLSPDQQFFAVGKAIASVQDPAERTADAMAIFGREGGRLVGVFREADFGKVGAGLQQKAEMMARNAAIFEQVSIKLEKVGNIAKTFYAGVADRVVTTLAPILDRLEKINLVAIGQKFGDGIAKGAQMFLGAFSHPELAASALENGLTAAVLQTGNVLAASLKAGGEFFQDGMLDSLQGIGSAIVATLMEAFDKPVRYLQAGIEAALETAQYLADKAMGKPDDDSVARGMTAKQRKDLADKLSASNEKMIDARYGPKDDTGDRGVHSPREISQEMMKNPTYRNTSEYIDQLRNYDPSKYATSVRSLPEIMAEHANEPTRFGLYGGGMTAAEWKQQAKDSTAAGWERATSVARNFKVDDMFGAGEYSQRATAASSRLAAYGQATARQWAQSQPAAAPAAPAASPLAQAQIRMAAAQNGINTKGMSDDALATLGQSLIYQKPASFNGRQNAADPYTARVDATRQRNQYLSHTIGIGGALDFDPSTRPGWTGATDAFAGFSKKDWANYRGTSAAPFANGTSLTTGGLGGGAYGQTGNIWKQISGKSSSNQDPVAKIEGHVGKMAGDMARLRQIWDGSGGGSSGGGGGGGTATGR